MTLYRQLLIYIFILFFLLFTGTWIVKLNSTRTFLQDQLESHAQDTATSLGLSISPHIQANDMAAVETMFNAVFDRGYYRIVRLVDIEENVLIDRTLQVAIEGVPQSFIRLVPLETPRATALVLSGWNRAGEVIVESHPGYAYKTLWETMVSTTKWFLAMFVLFLAAGLLGLHYLLKPLKQVEQQAEALCKRRYEIQEKVPWTRELRRVVEAMNKMTCKVKDMFDEQAGVAERLRKNAYRDSLTGLGNRRYLEGQVSTRLNRGESTLKGAFLLVQINDLQKLNMERGFPAGDEILRRIGRRLEEETRLVANSALARITGGDFGLFLPEVNGEDARLTAESIGRALSQLAVEGLALTDNVGHVGGVVYNRPASFRELLSTADTALQAACLEGKNRCVVQQLSADSEAAARGRQRWKEILMQALSEGDIVLYVQPTVRCSDPSILFHLEVFSRIREKSGKMLSAGMFMPLAERLGQVSSLDRLVLEKAMQASADALGTDQLAVNVSPSSLKNEEFSKWVVQALKKLPPGAPRLSFEFAEFSAVQHLDLIRSFGAQVQELGHGYGLDHFGQGFSNFGYLKSLRPDYVKIDRAYTDELKNKDSDSRFFIGSLTGVAHSLDIMVIAEGVENEEQFNLLQELNLDAIQGYFIGRPEPIRP
ncbi:MAG: EAL domain-containing protein [Desulfobulbaceae bacterium]|nr:EAL domain-containing protein [Desulfobulbaceae bacterium]